MADDDAPKPDNVLQFTPRHSSENALPADALLEDSLGDYEDVIILGVDATGEMTVSGNIADIAQVYEMLSSAAQNIALAHLEMIFHGTEH
jgi:hypothetical protein